MTQQPYYLTWNNSISNRRLVNLTNDLAGAPNTDEWVSFTAKIVYKTLSQFNKGADVSTVYSSQYTTG